VPYAGTCTDCDFAFQVTGTLTRDDGNGACPYWAPGTIYNTAAVYVAPDLLAFASKTTGPYWGDAYTDAFMLGSYDDFGFGKPFGPNWWFKSGGGFYDYGTASYSGGKLEWTYTPDVDMAPLYRSTDDYHEPTCSHDWTSYAKGP